MNNFQETFTRISEFEAANPIFELDSDESEFSSRQSAWQQVIAAQAQKRLEPAQISLQITSF